MSINSSQSPDSLQNRSAGLRRFITLRATAIVLVLAAVLCAGAAAVTRSETSDSVQASADVTILSVETVVLQRTEGMQQSRTYTGIIAARQSADLGFERAARLTAIHFDEGDIVLSGQPIATLDIRRLEAKRRETVARHDAAVAVLSELQAGPRKETVAAARAQVDDLKSQLELSERTFRRTTKLFQQNAATDADIDNSQLSLKSTQARLNVAQKQLDELLAGTRANRLPLRRQTFSSWSRRWRTSTLSWNTVF